jgi:aspartate/methionine/tyrosine aminotransferase
MSRTVSAPYIEWAKLSSSAPVSLAASGVPHATVADLGLTFDDVEIAGPSMYGYAPLVAAIAAKHGVRDECVVTAAGTSMANHLAMAGLVEPGDHVVIERPTYDPMLGVLEYLGARVSRVDRRPEEGFALDPDAVAAALTPATKLVVLANLHNPSSHLTTRETLASIGASAERVGARVLVDEVYLDAVFDAPQPSCVHLGPGFVSTNSLTKLYGLSGLRCGWVLAEPAVATRLWRLNDLFSNVPAFVAERFSARAFERVPALLERSRALLDANRRLVQDFFASRGDVSLRLPPYGTTVCFKVPGGRADALCRHLRSRYETSVVPGRFFEAPEFVRMGLCADPAVTSEGLARLGAALDDLAAGRVE